MDRISKAAMVSMGGYDEKKIFPEYFPLDVSGEDVDYSRVEWDSNVDFVAPSPDEMELIQQMLADNSVTVSAASVHEPEWDPGLSAALPDGFPGIEQIETDREWV